MKHTSGFLLQSASLAMLGLIAPLALHADSQLIVNGGFENGTYSSTINSATNSSIPNGWTPSYGFDWAPQWDHVNTGSGAFDGNAYLSIGNDDGNPEPDLSQTFSDVAGTTYFGSIYVDYGGAGTGDTNPYFDVWVDGTPLVTLTNLAPGVWTDYTFSFTGTGSDTLTLGGNTTPVEWFVDDVSVTGQAASVTPEPSSFLLLATGLAGFAGAIRRKLTN
jgi:PEP-CTERM motif